MSDANPRSGVALGTIVLVKQNDECFAATHESKAGLFGRQSGILSAVAFVANKCHTIITRALNLFDQRPTGITQSFNG
jgi:hypothetical protein